VASTTEKLPDTLEFLRNENDEAMTNESTHEQKHPKRPNERNDKELPTLTFSTKDNTFIPSHEISPLTDKLLPARPKERIDREDAK
jgi:hypothetical protein